MGTSRPLCVVITAALLSFGQTGHADSADEKAIYDVIEAAINADLDSNFPALCALLHPRTQHLFRDLLSARVDELSRTYSLENISAVSGLPAHPKDMRLSDAEFFIFACEQQRARHPEFVGDPSILPLTIRETTFHNGNCVDVALAYSRHLQTERTDVSFYRPFVLVLERDDSNWRLLSCPLADAIASNWSRDLARIAAAR